MSSLKTEVKSSETRMALNTTINKEILEEFKNSCKRSGVPMNTCIEAFMRQYNNGEFYIKFGRTSRKLNVNLDDKADKDFGIEDISEE